MAFEIRRASGDDAPAIRRVAREAWHAAYDDVLGEESVETVVDSWYDPDRLAASVDREDGRFLVAESRGEVVGFAQAVLGGRDGDDPDAAELPRIYVRPDRWGEGVGSALLERVEAWCRQRGAERLRLVVLADNEVGNAFYEKRGFRTVREREAELAGEAVAEYVREKAL